MKTMNTINREMVLVSFHSIRTFAVAILLIGVLMIQCNSKDKDPVLGGWSTLDKNAESLTEVKLFVEAELGLRDASLVLGNVESVETQVVAGVNYRIIWIGEEGDKSVRLETIVWKKIDGSMELTSYEKSFLP